MHHDLPTLQTAALLELFKGTLKSKEDIVVGIETLPGTLLKVFNGENFGKLVLQLAVK